MSTPSDRAMAVADKIMQVFEVYIERSTGLTFTDPEYRPKTLATLAKMIDQHFPDYDLLLDLQGGVVKEEEEDDDG